MGDPRPTAPGARQLRPQRSCVGSAKQPLQELASSSCRAQQGEDRVRAAWCLSSGGLESMGTAPKASRTAALCGHPRGSGRSRQRPRAQG